MGNVPKRVSAVIIDGKKVLLIYRINKSRKYWVFPGGRVEVGETPKNAIIREVKEETNLDVKSLEYTFDYLDENHFAHPVFYCKVGKGKLEFIGPEIKFLTKDNWYEPRWIDLKSAIRLNVYPEEGKKLLIQTINSSKK